MTFVTGRIGQPLPVITRYESLSQASETKAVSFDKIQFVSASLYFKLYEAFNRWSVVLRNEHCGCDFEVLFGSFELSSVDLVL